MSASRWVTAALAATVMVGGASPSRALAQIPTMDTHEEAISGESMLERFAEWYATADQWRKSLLDKANAMIQDTRLAVQLRQQAENRAVGELGTLGGRIPDWRQGGNYCGVNAGGATQCPTTSYLTSTFERPTATTAHTYPSPLFATTTTADSELGSIIGQAWSPVGNYVTEVQNTPVARLGQSFSSLDTLAKAGPALTSAGQNLNATLDTMVTTAVAGQPLSSGRALQLRATIADAEATAELTTVYGRLRSLESATMRVADKVAAYRTQKRVIDGLGFEW
jgi:hypothetical protein